MAVFTIGMPAFNRAGVISRAIDSILAQTFDDFELVIVDDGSSDGTRELYPKIKARWPDETITVQLQSVNKGKGAAVREGFKLATGDIFLIQDADLEYNPEDYNYLLKPILTDKADVVYGSRFRGGAAHRVDRFWHMVGNRFVTLISNMFTDLNLTDMETCYKVFRSEVIRGITFRCNGFAFAPEFTAKVARARHNGKRWRVYEVGISYAGRSLDEGKKISWRDGFPALWAIIKYRFFD